MATTRTVEVDVRPIPVREKHHTIFRTFDRLAAGEAILLINDHDPKPPYYTFMAERAGAFASNYLEQGPGVWRVETRRVR